MKVIKKIITLFSVVAIILTSGVQTYAATTFDSCNPIPKAMYPQADGSIGKMQNVTYISPKKSDIKYVIESVQNSYVQIIDVNSDNNGGKHALRLYGKHSGDDKYAKISMFIGEKTANNKYVISFDIAHANAYWLDYVALNEGGNNSYARLMSLEGKYETQWINPTSLGTGYNPNNRENGLNWSRYEKTLTTINDPQLNFAVYQYGLMYIDNIVVKDTEGNIIFAEDFETPAEELNIPEIPSEPSEPDEPDEPDEPAGEEGEGLIPEAMYPRADGSIDKIQNVTYISEVNENIKYVFESSDKSYAQVIDVNSEDDAGKYALRLYGKHSDDTKYVKLSMFIGNRTGDNKYVISFDVARPDDTYYRNAKDYVALNDGNYDGFARLDSSETQWTKTLVGQGSNPSNRTPAPGTWYRYEATLSTTEYPQLNFYVVNRSLMYIDNIVVKDSYGNVIFEEGFEYPLKEKQEVPDVPIVPDGEKVYDPIPKSAYPTDGTTDATYYKMQNITYTSNENPNVKYMVTTKDTAFAMIMNANSEKVGGQYSLRIYGKGTNIGGTTGSAKVSFYFGQKTPDNKYLISFDAYRVYTSDKDYATLNEKNWDLGACLDRTSLWNVTKIGKGYDAGYSLGEWKRYEATITAEGDPHLDVSVYDYGVVFIDNIVVKDTTGNIIFKEDFEVVEVVDEVSSKINVPKFETVEKVGDSYQVVGVADRLTSYTILKTSVKAENFTESDGVNAIIFTALYKDKTLLFADVQTISVAIGNEETSGSIVNVPSLEDGEYTVKVFIWDSSANSLVKVQSLSE